MSNIVPANIQVPTHLANRIGASSVLGAALTGGLSSGNSFPKISIKGSRFRIVEGDTETVLDSTNLDVVIVGANPRLSKTWYAKAWTKDAEPTAAAAATAATAAATAAAVAVVVVVLAAAFCRRRQPPSSHP